MFYGEQRIGKITIIVVIVVVVIVYNVFELDLWSNEGGETGGVANEIGINDDVNVDDINTNDIETNTISNEINIPINVNTQSNVNSNPKRSLTKGALVLFISSRINIPDALLTIKSFQDHFNNQYHHDWVILSTKNILSTSKPQLAAMANGENVKFVDLGKHFFTIPSTVSATKIKRRKPKDIPQYARDQFTRFSKQLTRFLAGSFYNLDNIWLDYDYYWKVPVGSSLGCDVNYDVFEYMNQNGIQYGWLLMQKTLPDVNTGLINHIEDYLKTSPITSEENVDFVSKYIQSCSFVTEFELASLSFFKSAQYQSFFNFLDQFNGIFYQEWSENAIKTLAVSLFLPKKLVKFFSDLPVEYLTYGITNCPPNPTFYWENKCTCDPYMTLKSFDIGSRSGNSFKVPYLKMHDNECVSQWLQGRNIPVPEVHKGEEEFRKLWSEEEEILHS